MAENRDDFVWTPQADAAALVRGALADFASDSPAAVKLASRLLNETGTRLVDWLDHLVLPADDALAAELKTAGFEQAASLELATLSDQVAWRHAGGMFPVILLDSSPSKGNGSVGERCSRRLAIRVDSVDDFVAAQRLDSLSLADAQIEGAAGGRFRTVVFAREGNVELMAVERHGYAGFAPTTDSEDKIVAAAEHHAAFEARKRDFKRPNDGFKKARKLIEEAIDDLGADWTCDLFFDSERHYWQGKNRAGQIQKARQDALGLGWGNQDHHTYRSSREHFSTLIALLEQFGFVCRERFYAGEEAGWGAQVLEHPVCGIAVFADVDLTPEEVTGDFAHEPLEALAEVGTIGLWCALHGEAILAAGMHHLECQFNFNAAVEQLASEGIDTMPPFTDLEFLKQAFTEGEIWPVAEAKIEAARASGLIDGDQAKQFAASGALGSHLEILERNQGYKGFNQTGISQIIRETDPRA